MDCVRVGTICAGVASTSEAAGMYLEMYKFNIEPELNKIETAGLSGTGSLEPQSILQPG